MSSTRQQGVREAVMRNARAAFREQLRNQALAEDPTLAADPEALACRVDELLREVRRYGGRRGAAATRARLRAARRFQDNCDVLLEQLDLLGQLIRSAANPHATCAHQWPGDLDEDPFCQRCGLHYVDFSEKEVAA